MISNRKRKHEEIEIETSLFKRRRNEPSLSFFDKTFNRIGSWLRRKFGRRHRPPLHTEMSDKINLKSTNQEVIIIDDDDDDDPVTSSQLYFSPSLPLTTTSTTTNGFPTSGLSNNSFPTSALSNNLPTSALPTSALPTSALPTSALPTSALPTNTLHTGGLSNNDLSTSSPINSTSFNRLRPLVSPIKSTTVSTGNKRGTTYVESKRTVSSIDIARKKQDRAMFQKLIDSKVLQGERKGTPPMTTTTTTTNTPIVKLYSVDHRPSSSTSSSLYSSSKTRTTQQLTNKTPHTLFSSSNHSTYIRDPNITLSSSRTPLYLRQPLSLTTPPTSSAFISRKPESLSSNRKPSYSHFPSPSVPISRINNVSTTSPLNPVRTISNNSNHSSTTSSEINEWFTAFKQKYQNSSDYQAKVDVAQKYAKIHQQERLKAEDARAEKLVGWMNQLKVRPWLPDIQDDDIDELSLFLDEETNQHINDIWSGHRYLQQHVFSEGYNIKIKKCDLSTLRGLEWLNDEVINFYLNLVTSTVNEEGTKKVHLFNSFFYPKIMSAGYSGVRRWTKKVDIFSFDLILLPIHLGMHWCLATIDFNKKQIGYYDSLKGNNRKCLTTLRDYLVSEAQDKKQMHYDVSDWILECFENIPEQYNGSDCGVFTCMYARHLARDKSFKFSQNDMPCIRRLMVAEIVNKQLL